MTKKMKNGFCAKMKNGEDPMEALDSASSVCL
jgi:hypothetical protein